MFFPSIREEDADLSIKLRESTSLKNFLTLKRTLDQELMNSQLSSVYMAMLSFTRHWEASSLMNDFELLAH